MFVQDGGNSGGRTRVGTHSWGSLMDDEQEGKNGGGNGGENK